MSFKRIMNARKYPHRVCLRSLNCFEHSQERQLQDGGAAAPMHRASAKDLLPPLLSYQRSPNKPTSTHTSTHMSQTGLLSFTQAFGADSQTFKLVL